MTSTSRSAKWIGVAFRTAVLVGAFAAGFVGSVVAKETPDSKAASAQGGVAIGGEGIAATHLSLADLAKHPHVTVHASAHGVEGEFSGVPLIDLVTTAGAPSGEKLRGAALALYVRVTASDGYRAVFALAELDPGTGNAQAILADAHDGKPLDAKEGPLRIIVPGDRRPARWVRQVVAIDVLRAPD